MTVNPKLPTRYSVPRPIVLGCATKDNGCVRNSLSDEATYVVSIRNKDGNEGTFSDRSCFQLKTIQALSLTLSISAFGFEPKEVVVESTASTMEIPLNVSLILRQEMVTVGQVSSKDIHNAAQINYMDMLRGVNVTIAKGLGVNDETNKNSLGIVDLDGIFFILVYE